VRSGVLTAVEFDGVGYKWSGDTATVEVHCWTCPLDLPFLMKELFSCKNKNLSLWATQVLDLDCQDFRIIGCWIDIHLL
jgi:hypothetical protein